MITNNEILVTIRCIVYNHEPYLRQCLDGFVMQKTNFKFEAWVHDDASTDGSPAIIKEYAEKYPEIIKPYFETENQYSKHDGSFQEITYNPQYLRGKYIAFCEGDDYWIDPLKLQKQVDYLEKHPDCSISFCKVQTITKDNKILDWTIPYKDDIKNGTITLKDYIKEEFFNGHWTFHTSSMIIRALFLDNYIRDELFKKFPYGDMPIMLYFLRKGNGYFFSEIGSHYRWLSGGYNSSLKNNPQKTIRDNTHLIEGLKYFDKLTGYIFSKYITRRIHKAEYDNYKLNCDYLALYNPRYWHFMSKYDFYLLRIKILEKIFPHIHQLYRIVKNRK